MFWGLFDIALTAIDTAFYMLLLITHLGLKGSMKKGYSFLCGAFIVFTVFTYNYLTQNSVYSIFLALGMVIIYSVFLTKGKWFFKIFWIVFPAILMVCIEAMALSALLTANPEALTVSYALPSMYRIQLAAIAKVLQIALLFFLIRLKLDLEHFGYSELLILIAPALVGTGVVFSQVQGLYDGRIIDPLVPLLASSVLLGFNLLILWLITFIDKKNKKICDYELQRQELKTKSYEHFSSAIEKFVDFQEGVDEITKDSWIALKDEYSMLRRDYRIDQYKMILSKVTQLKQSFNMIYRTGDALLDTALSSMDALARKKDIRIESNIDFPDEYKYESGFIGSILVHVLGNAIEIVDSVDDIECEKIIELSVEVNSEAIKIIVANPADKLTEMRMEEKDSYPALKVVQSMISRYKGTIEAKCEYYYFDVEIELPLSSIVVDTEKVKC